jgi:hypothetical protein
MRSLVKYTGCLACLVVCAGVAMPMYAQETKTPETLTSQESISHGEFAQIVLQALQTYNGSIPDPLLALDQVKRYGVVPVDWVAGDVLTRGELAEIAGRMGVDYFPVDLDAPVSRDFAVTIVRRGLARLMDYMARRMGHGFSSNHILDEGVDRAVRPVSPSDF